MTLSAEEFIRRLLLHVLPDGSHRIRYFGFLGNRYRQEKLARYSHLSPEHRQSVVERIAGAGQPRTSTE
jgi:hypothetical protein